MTPIGGKVLNSNIVIVPKGWGFEKWCVNKEFCGKELFFFSGRKCSFHYHKIKDETFLVQSGQFIIRHFLPAMVFQGRVFSPWWEICTWANAFADQWLRQATVDVLLPGDVFDVPPGLIHQMEAVGDSKLVEFSSHHEDSDSYRVIKGD